MRLVHVPASLVQPVTFPNPPHVSFLFYLLFFLFFFFLTWTGGLDVHPARGRIFPASMETCPIWSKSLH
ncbi:hypothetical protein BDQ94DRAFT_140570 [Aspergillus welwitschiae]|uniref:Uncharacterized protein n=1 Tax=Aspergillus welwitschiae TaxID=1341132 RepID=A0A3F3Q969_9EURO|nr:hypothetical protein BDQ94DRAFT_140570 [Aspergillus welwitschiae]RDH35286.1 hypothetical protein BDQ94DRAFT_140570 [Aspergillus welwitschiae]